jgi:cycloeucalenol cycloisomerase
MSTAVPVTQAATSARAQRCSSLFAPHPGKRRAEQLWLAYTPVWGLVCAVVMVGGFAERWGDLGLLTLGVVIALPAVLLPLRGSSAEERSRPLHDRAGFKLALSVVAFSFMLNYTQTPFFFDVLHAHFGFHSTINIRNNPVFLYFMTVAYFSTYCVLLMMAQRATQRLLRGAPAGVRWLGVAVCCVAVACLEAVLNANPFTQRLYCFDDVPFALWFGSLVYGVSFLCILPVWIRIDERPGERMPCWHVLAFVAAAVYADSLALDVARYHVAPHFTVVRAGAAGLGDVATSCLGRASLPR